MTTIVNGRLLWQWSNAITMKWKAGFSFNWFNLDNWKNIRVTSCNSDDLWAVDLETFNYAMQDWGWVLWRYFRTHTINIWLSLVESSHEKLLALMDEIKYQCSAIEAPLRIKSGELIRERTATCTDIKFNREYYNINWLWEVQLVFKATKPHSHTLAPISMNFIQQTWIYKTSIGYMWRAWSFFVLNVAIETAATYTLSYVLNWFTLSIPSRTYQVWDLVKFDWTSKKVTINNNEVEYIWSFRPLKYWDNPLEINYSWTYTASLSYNENFL